MPRRRRTSLGRHTAEAKKMRLKRNNESKDERDARLLSQRKRRRTDETKHPWTNKECCGFNYHPSLDYRNDAMVALGTIPLMCTYCSASPWKNDSKENHLKPTDSEATIVGQEMALEKDIFYEQIFFNCAIEIPKYKCSICPNFQTNFLVCLKGHIRDSHRNANSGSATFTNIDWFYCEQCTYKCKHRKHLVRHTRSHHTKPENIHWFECRQCCSKFKTKRTLQKHITAHHPEPQEIPLFPCPQCTYKFKDKTNLQKHLKYRHGQLENILCSPEVQSNSHLEYSNSSHHVNSENIRWFECKQCSIRFATIEILKRHQTARHARPADMHWPDKSKASGNLESHAAKRHPEPEDDQCFQCEQCTSKFKSEANLKYHLRIAHSTLEDFGWFNCEQCPSKFKSRKGLKQHGEFHLRKSEDIHTQSVDIHLNTVQRLIDNPFITRSSIEKIETKKCGRPTPKLNIIQSISSKKRTFNRTFNPDIYKKHTWICGCDVRNALFCFPCLLFGGEESWTKVGLTDLNHLGDRIKKHMLSEKHMKNVLQLSLFGSVNIAAQLDRRTVQLHNEKVRHNRYILNIMINCVRFCGAFELALRGDDESAHASPSSPGVFRELINFSAQLDVALKEHLDKTTVFKGASLTIQNEILQAMFCVCQEEISKEIEEAEYLSIIVDETSDVSNMYQMAIVFRYIARTRGKPVERFWDLLTPSNYDTQALSSVLLAELEKHLKDDTRKLIAQTYDGTAVMSGSPKGVPAIVKQTYQNAAYVHCYAHQLDLVMLNAASANTNVRIFFANLQGICTFFSNTPQRTAILDEIVKKRSPSSAPTRWNFSSRIVFTVFEHREDIIQTMRKILSNSKNASTTTINQASGYITILTSRSFVFWLNLFYKIMPHVDTLFAKFQTEKINPMVSDIYILSFETQLTQIRNSITKLPDTNEPSTTKRLHIEWDGCTREAQEVCDIIICQAKDRLGFTGHLFAATLFFSENYRQYSASFPEKKLQETITAYPFLNGQKLRTELSVIYEMVEFSFISGLLPLYDSISQNGELLSETFSETLKLLKILITIPMVSNEAECCFPTINKIKTFLRNTMNQDGLSALAMISQERDLIESIPDFNQRVIDKFANTKDRRMDFLFQ